MLAVSGGGIIHQFIAMSQLLEGNLVIVPDL